MTAAVDLRALSDELGIPLAELEQAQRDGVLDAGSDVAVNAIARWLDDPVAFVVENFRPKPTEFSPDGVDWWQKEGLYSFRDNPRTALQACKGPGKTTDLAWMLWWALALHAHANGIALAITKDNLRDNLWKEAALWYARSPWLQREFAMTAERIFHRKHKDTWWASARSFAQDARSDQQANTLAGLHSQSFVFIIVDESSDVPVGVFQAAEGIFANEHQVTARLAQAGNCTKQEGPLWDACTSQRSIWHVIRITGDPDDPRRSPRISMEYARKTIELWGRDSPIVKVNILGEFPPTSPDKLVGPDDITRAQERWPQPEEYLRAPEVWALDVGRFGNDPSHLRKRQGPVLFRGHSFRNLDGPTLASQVSIIIQQDMEKTGRRPDAIFVDQTGVGAAAYDSLKLLGWGDILIGVDNAQQAQAPDKFYNCRAESWYRAAQWLRKVGSIPSGSNQLGAELQAPRFFYRKVGNRTVFILESKDDLRKRGIPSPNEADALALSFVNESIIRREDVLPGAPYAPHAYAPSSSAALAGYDPYDEGRI